MEVCVREAVNGIAIFGSIDASVAMIATGGTSLRAGPSRGAKGQKLLVSQRRPTVVQRVRKMQGLDTEGARAQSI